MLVRTLAGNYASEVFKRSWLVVLFLGLSLLQRCHGLRDARQTLKAVYSVLVVIIHASTTEAHQEQS